MLLVNSDIEKFNQYVSDNIGSLKFRDETSEDFLDNSFKSYKVACDCKFVEYIEQKDADYFDGIE